MLPILDPMLRDRVIEEGLNTYLLDNTQAWLLQPSGEWLRADAGEEPPHIAQQVLLKKLT